MTEDHLERGRTASGGRRWRAIVTVALLATAVTLASVPLALGSSGGAGIGAQPRPAHHAPVHRRTAPLRRTTPRRPTRPRRQRVATARLGPFAGRGMWIWYVSRSDGGDVASIIAKAHRFGVSTLLIKSGDGSGVWSQFNSTLVGRLHAGGLRVCAWQYVYGNEPVAEAQVGAHAARSGADCLVIDAEGEYEGKYVQAQTYIGRLRQLIGSRFPVALAGLPYVDYHPGYPYSIFLGPGGAQYNLPQMYWADIGVSVDSVYAHTYAFNQIYRRTISPLGEVTGSPPTAQIRRFRQLSRSIGAPGVSWWDWQESAPRSWRAISQPVASLAGVHSAPRPAGVAQGARGDLVVWAQEHLRSAGLNVMIDGDFGPGTKRAVASFQRAHALPAIGRVGPATWQALLRYRPASVHWTSRGARTASAASSGLWLPVPKSASLRARGYEIPRSRGRG